MSLSVWRFENYKDYLTAVVEDGERGVVSRLAEAAACQRSYLSNALHSHVHLLPDQVYGICRYLELSEDESRYLLLLLEKDRAGAPAYRRHLKDRIRELRDRHEDLAQRLDRSPLRNPVDQSRYYSSWHYAAIHILVSIPRFGSVAVIARALEMDPETVAATLGELEAMGLVHQAGGRWKFLTGDIHIPKDSPLVSLHHNNWRQRAVLHSQGRRDGIHFTMVQAVSAKVALEIKESVLRLIDESAALAGPSAAEELVYFGTDFYRLS